MIINVNQDVPPGYQKHPQEFILEKRKQKG